MPIIIPASSARDGWIGNRKIDDCVAIFNCGGGDVSGGGREGGRGVGELAGHVAHDEGGPFRNCA